MSSPRRDAGCWVITAVNLGRYTVSLVEYRRFGESCYCIFNVNGYKNFFCLDLLTLGPGVAQWLRRCATSRTVPGSIPGCVIGFFSDVFPSDRTIAGGSTQPLVEMSTTNIPGGKGGWCVRLTTYHHTVPLSRNLGALTS